MSSSHREGDWACPSCQHLNFKKRDSCQQCSCPKIATAVEVASYAAMHSANSGILPGDWFCATVNCRAHNYASRPSCYVCGGYKEEYGYAPGTMPSAAFSPDSIPGWKSGDWICSRPGCSMHNYASRILCYKCKTPK